MPRSKGEGKCDAYEKLKNKWSSEAGVEAANKCAQGGADDEAEDNPPVAQECCDLAQPTPDEDGWSNSDPPIPACAGDDGAAVCGQ